MTSYEEETEMQDEEEEKTEEEVEQDSSDSKIKREYKKKKKLISKTKKKVQQAFLAKMQIVLAAIILLVVVSWDGVQSILHWAAGQKEITVWSKSVENDCLQILTDENDSYCVDQESYDMALKGHDYLLEEYQYSFKLREVSK